MRGGVSLLVTLVAIYGALATWQWQRRERQMRAAWRRFKSSLDLETSRPRIDRCIELLVAEYGLDTFTRPQMEAVPSSPSAGAGLAAHYAQVAGERWQITLPPVQFRMLGRQGHGFAGTFGSGYSWTANPAAAQESPDRMVEWSDIYEIQLASSTLSDAEALPVVVAHEVSHLVLERDRVTTGRRAEDEVLTDVATALIGYGFLMRRLRSRERRFFGPGIQLSWSISGPGYLFPEELDYVLHRQEQLMQGPQDGTAASSEVAT
jgi:hypothetical protein